MGTRLILVLVHIAVPEFLFGIEVKGTAVIPHVPVREMKFRRPVEFHEGARLQLFLFNDGSKPVSLRGARVGDQTPQDLVQSEVWSWHDFPSLWKEEHRELPPGALTCWAWNQATRFSDGSAKIRYGGNTETVTLRRPRVWLASATFLGPTGKIYPDRLVVHVRNASEMPVRLKSLRLWLPRSNSSFRFLYPTGTPTSLQFFPGDGRIAPGDTGCLVAEFSSLPLTYGAIELDAERDGSPVQLWGHLRIKKEVFDIGGGWVHTNSVAGGSLKSVPFLKTLRGLHVSSGMHDAVPGYTDSSGPDSLYARYPIKMMNRLRPIERFDRDSVLPRIHAVEFLGEPQYRARTKGAMPPKVLEAFRPYASTRLHTSVTLSDPSTWHLWAGLSDYPHYDAYRVTAPAADSWRRYERWGETRIRWGAPLETVGDMTRSLRENSRPAPIAYWSQGPHHDWRGYRKRASPTADELRVQAYHGLSSRITSLYWFNLSPAALVQFRDTLEELQRIGREIRLLEEHYLEGAAYDYRRVFRDGSPSADCAVIASTRGAVLFAIDLDYRPDTDEQVFQFSAPRQEVFEFALPGYLRSFKDVFRIDADGVHDCQYTATDRGVKVDAEFSRVAVWVVSPDPEARERLAKRHRELLAFERSLDFDPARRQADFDALRKLLRN